MKRTFGRFVAVGSCAANAEAHSSAHRKHRTVCLIISSPFQGHNGATTNSVTDVDSASGTRRRLSAFQESRATIRAWVLTARAKPSLRVRAESPDPSQHIAP